MNTQVIARFGVATVWAHQGICQKVLGGDPRHREIVSRVPGLGRRGARAAVTGIGLGEGLLAAWIVSGRQRRAAAAVQTVVLVTINAGGLVFARSLIRHPGRMLVRTGAFLGLIWSVA